MGTPPDDRLARQLAFVLEVDRLKTVDRRSAIVGGARVENSAEHSWHLALMALVLADRAAEPVDAAHVVAMLLVHDLVEIDAGDTFVYDDDPGTAAAKAAREQAGADRLFGLLPPDLGARLRLLWEEFEVGDTPEARFARAVDRLQPMLLNHANGGEVWRRNGITAERVRARNRHIDEGAPALWVWAQHLVDECVARGEIDER